MIRKLEEVICLFASFEYEMLARLSFRSICVASSRDAVGDFFCRINQPPLLAYLIHRAHQTQTVCIGHDFAFGFAVEQTVHHLLGFELVAIPVIG